MTAAWPWPCWNSRAAANRRASSAALRRAPRCGVVMPQHRMVLDEIHHFISRDSLGFEFPEHHRNLVVLENTATVHNVIVCTLCSCTAYTIIGAAPDWYKDLDYRARVVRESRTVLREMGLDLPATTEI